MKKYLLSILTLFILLFSLTSCDTSNIEKDYHDLKLAYDENSHYDLCECGHKENEEAHIFSDAIHVISYPTCTTEGIEEYHCIVCNYKEQRTTPALGHKYGDWEVVTEPTCISKGQAKRVCELCGAEEYKDIDIISHTPVANTELESSCTHTGLTGGTHCSVCNQELSPSTVVDKKEHNYGDWTTTIEADCTHKGQEVRVCQDCNHEEYREVAIKSHTATPYTDLEANCQHEGHVGGTYCSVCNQELTPYTTIDKTAHDYGDWVTTQNPTCISFGQAKRVCNVCGHEDFKVLDKIDHTPTPGTATTSTCKEHGHTAGSYCSFCHQELEAPEELPLGDHNYSIETVTKAATLTSDGILTHTCSVCGDSYETTIDRLPLTWNIWYKSLTKANFQNKYLEMYYEDHEYNKKLDITITVKDLTTYVKVTTGCN